MKIVWKSAPINTNEITERLLKTTSWSAKTIQTLIKRLVTKGALTYEKQGRVFVYTPLVEENEYISQQSNSFIKRFYDGDISAMLSAYLENNQLSETELNHLRSLLSKKIKIRRWFYDRLYHTFFDLQFTDQWHDRYFVCCQKNIEGSPDKQDTIQSVVPAAALLFPGTTPALIIYAESDSRYQRNTSGKDCALIKQ